MGLLDVTAVLISLYRQQFTGFRDQAGNKYVEVDDDCALLESVFWM